MSDLLGKIRSRGYWQVVIRPTTFTNSRVLSISSLYPIVRKCSVQLRGWDYPHVDVNTPPIIDVDWVGQETEWESFLELWRLYQSGQFIHVFGMDEDWVELSSWQKAETAPGEQLWLGNALLTCTEILEFAARLALSEAGDQTMYLEINLHGLKKRSLVNELRGGRPLRGQPATVDSLPFSISLAQADLLANPRELALEPAANIFQRFGKDFSKDILRAHQEALLIRGARWGT